VVICFVSLRFSRDCHNDKTSKKRNT